jgi:hypothetical protein
MLAARILPEGRTALWRGCRDVFSLLPLFLFLIILLVKQIYISVVLIRFFDTNIIVEAVLSPEN